MDHRRETGSGPDRRARPEDVTEALRSAVERTLAATAGSATGTRRRAQELLDEVARRGQAAREEVGKRGDQARQQVTRRGEQARQEVSRRGEEARQEMARRRAEAREALAERIAALERRLGELETSVRDHTPPEGEGDTGQPKPQVDVEESPSEADDG